INDRYGHPAGDAVLVEFSHAVASIIRRNEMFFRLGGDEFAVLVPDTDLTQTENLARRIVQRVSDLRFTFGDQSVGISVSLGIGLSPVHAIDQANLVDVTDQALYRAKAGGKNGWRFAEACPPTGAASSNSD
ncbi:partial Cyclic di-GMP phosphodiesterase PdeR, partial [Planctomycetaceae bacterium]